MDSQSGKWIGNRIIYYLSNETINKTLEFQTKDSLYNYLRKIDDLKIPEKAEKFEPKEEKQPAVTKQVKQGKTIKEINDEILRLKKKENKVRKIQRSAEATQAVPPLGLFFGLTGNRPQSAPACSFLRYNPL